MSTPDPALTDWVPLWSLGEQLGPQIPAPVQNGKWLTGSGGAVVWADAPAATLPDRLNIYGKYTADWNTAAETGWYYSNVDTVNNPAYDYFLGEVWAWTDPTNWILQRAYRFTTLSGQFVPSFVRTKSNGAWVPWRQDRAVVLAGEVNADGTVAKGSEFSCWQPAIGTYEITGLSFPAPPVVVVTPMVTAFTAKLRDPPSTSNIVIEIRDTLWQTTSSRFSFIAVAP